MKPANVSDEGLVKEFISGNANAINELLVRYKRRLYTYLYICVKNRQLAEDLFQETFYKAIKSLREGKYQEDGKFYPWIVRIAHNLVIDQVRKDQKMKIISRDDYSYDFFNQKRYSVCDTENTKMRGVVLKDMRKLIEKLPETQKEVVIMRHFLGMSFKEIADETNVSINTALGRMRYALMNIRRMMDEKSLQIEISEIL